MNNTKKSPAITVLSIPKFSRTNPVLAPVAECLYPKIRPTTIGRANPNKPAQTKGFWADLSPQEFQPFLAKIGRFEKP
jgi:hypothetical protein